MDIYDGAEWTEMDIEDLKAAIESCRSIEEAAEFLCRAESVEDVTRKCEELGLKAKGEIGIALRAGIRRLPNIETLEPRAR
jgi:hypothetical protein